MKGVFKREITNAKTDLILANLISTLENISMAHSMRINRLHNPAKHLEADLPSGAE